MNSKIFIDQRYLLRKRIAKRQSEAKVLSFNV